MVSFITLHLRKKQIKKEVKHFLMQTVNKKDLFYFKFSQQEIKEELRWEKVHEFEYKGKMYDIVEQKSEKDSTAYWCWLDKEETALNNKLHRLTHFNFFDDEQKKNCEGSLVYLIKNQYFPPNHNFQLYCALNCRKDNFKKVFRCLEPSYSPQSPPPDLL